ncbi:MAG: hypothetical protein HC780_21155 [Leptolyngbyaceae cyanobacterium CSU_1_3]|nr:hypothetical protein [Leptolyngbyaceae cyanobacterium CSU_1_3]
MKLQSTNQFLRSASFKHIAKFAAGLSLSAGIFAIGESISPTAAKAQASILVQSQATSNLAQSQATSKVEATAAASSLPNGVYLYGQSAQPDQVGKAYFVFEVNQGNVLGALYMPRSSFDCTYGKFQSGRVALTVIDSYEKTRHPYAIALVRNTSVATTGSPALNSINLEGFQPLKKLSETDKKILSVCKQNYPNALK